MSNLPGRTVTRGRGQRPGSEEQGPRHWLRQLLASGARAAAGTGGAEAGGEGGALGHLAASTGFAWAKKSRPDATAAAAVTKTTARESRCPRPPVAATSAASAAARGRNVHRVRIRLGRARHTVDPSPVAAAARETRCPWPTTVIGGDEP